MGHKKIIIINSFHNNFSLHLNLPLHSLQLFQVKSFRKKANHNIFSMLQIIIKNFAWNNLSKKLGFHTSLCHRFFLLFTCQLRSCIQSLSLYLSISLTSPFSILFFLAHLSRLLSHPLSFSTTINNSEPLLRPTNFDKHRFNYCSNLNDVTHSMNTTRASFICHCIIYMCSNGQIKFDPTWPKVVNSSCYCPYILK